MSNAVVEKVLAVAKSQIGVKESGGNNHGDRVHHYQNVAGVGHGEPWCAAFTFCCAVEGGAKGILKSGYCPAIEDWARDVGILYAGNSGQAHAVRAKHGAPKRGDFFLLQMHDAQGRYSGHIGFVTAVAGGHVETIEGNTGGYSDTDGQGVFAKQRAIEDCLFVRWADLKENAKPPLVVTAGGKPIPCHPNVEDGTTRVDLRPVVEALGFSLDTSKIAAGEIGIFRP